jgi:hypothetical protein
VEKDKGKERNEEKGTGQSAVHGLLLLVVAEQS